jgi:hypothetical protein
MQIRFHRFAVVLAAPLLGLAFSACSSSNSGTGVPGISPASSDAKTTAGLAVSPNAATIAAGTSMTFTVRVTGLASKDVTWSVREGDAGGTIAADGSYVAPATAGTHHVVATSVADPTKSNVAVVTVTAAQSTSSGSTGSTGSTGPQYYVATNGNDANPGTIDQPWRTIQKAMNTARPGDTVNIRGGSYTERLSVNVSGTAGNYITFQNYGFTAPTGAPPYPGAAGGEQVILDYSSLGTVSDNVPFLGIIGQSYVRVQGLTFQNYKTVGGGPQYGLLVKGSSFVELNSNRLLTIQNTGVWDGTNATEVFFVRGSSHDVLIHGNEVANAITIYGEAMTVDEGSYNVTIEQNYLHDTDAIGIDLNQNSSNNVVRSNLLEYIGKKRDGTIWYNNPAQAVYVQGGTNAIIERNVVRHSCNAYGVDSEPNYPAAHDIVFRSNLSYDNDQGIKLGTWYSDTDGSNTYNLSAYNNTIYDSGEGIVIRPMSGTNTIENNIVVGGMGYVNAGGWSPGTMDYNLWYQVSTVGPDAHALRGDPAFANAANGDFSLTSGSIAIGAGNSATGSMIGSLDYAGNPRVVGGRVDAGALEYQ